MKEPEDNVSRVELQSQVPAVGTTANSAIGDVPSVSPNERARRALTIVSHELGTATISLCGLTLTDLRVDLQQRVADAIADAEEELTRAWAARMTFECERTNELRAFLAAKDAELKAMAAYNADEHRAWIDQSQRTDKAEASLAALTVEVERLKAELRKKYLDEHAVDRRMLETSEAECHALRETLETLRAEHATCPQKERRWDATDID